MDNRVYYRGGLVRMYDTPVPDLCLDSTDLVYGYACYGPDFEFLTMYDLTLGTKWLDERISYYDDLHKRKEGKQ